MYLKGLRPIKLTYDFYCKKKSLRQEFNGNIGVVVAW